MQTEWNQNHGDLHLQKIGKSCRARSGYHHSSCIEHIIKARFNEGSRSIPFTNDLLERPFACLVEHRTNFQKLIQRIPYQGIYLQSSLTSTQHHNKWTIARQIETIECSLSHSQFSMHTCRNTGHQKSILHA